MISQFARMPFDQTETDSKSRLAMVSAMSATGLMLISIAFSGGRAEFAYSKPIYWLGLISMSAPIIFRLMMPTVSRRERMSLIVVAGVLFYLVKIFYSPTEFQFADEFAHWRSSADLIEKEQLFQSNPLLAVSPFYPGLHSMTSAVVNMTGISIFHAGLIIIGVGRIVTVLSLYLMYEQVGKSSQIAGVAAFIYMTNPHFLFFNAFFVYQSLAVSFAFLFLYTVVRARYMSGQYSIPLKIVAVLAMLAMTMTHHVTSIALLCFFILWTIVEALLPKFVKLEEHANPFWFTSLATITILSWMIYVATVVVMYLYAPLSDAAGSLFNVILQDTEVDEVFIAPTGPIYERLTGMSAIGWIALFLMPGMLILLLRYRKNAVAMSLGIASMGFYISIMLRLSSAQGAELAGRSWTFIYLPVAFTVAVFFVDVARFLKWRWYVRAAFTAFVIWFFMGGIMSGWPPYWGRLPGPYLVTAFERSVNDESLRMGEWTNTHLGRDNIVIADANNYDILASYGYQTPIRGLAWVFFTPGLGDAEALDIQQKKADYFIIDKRLTQGTPTLGFYFDGGEPGAFKHFAPLFPWQLDKFATERTLNRIFDSGNIAIYDVKSWANTR